MVATKSRYIGKAVPQIDSELKVTGTASYAFDIELPGMLFAKLVTSDRPHARILSIDTSEAEKVKGVVCVAAVVAESLSAAEEAAAKVRVEYEDLPAVLDVKEALKPDAPIIHEKLAEYRVFPAFKPVPGTNIANRFSLKRGDLEEGFARSDLIIEDEFS